MRERNKSVVKNNETSKTRVNNTANRKKPSKLFQFIKHTTVVATAEWSKPNVNQHWFSENRLILKFQANPPKKMPRYRYQRRIEKLPREAPDIGQYILKCHQNKCMSKYNRIWSWWEIPCISSCDIVIIVIVKNTVYD